MVYFLGDWGMGDSDIIKYENVTNVQSEHQHHQIQSLYQQEHQQQIQNDQQQQQQQQRLSTINVQQLNAQYQQQSITNHLRRRSDGIASDLIRLHSVSNSLSNDNDDDNDQESDDDDDEISLHPLNNQVSIIN